MTCTDAFLGRYNASRLLDRVKPRNGTHASERPESVKPKEREDEKREAQERAARERDARTFVPLVSRNRYALPMFV